MHAQNHSFREPHPRTRLFLGSIGLGVLVFVCIAFVMYSKQGRRPTSLANAQLAALSVYAAEFVRQHERFPESLEELSDTRLGAVATNSTVDPWGEAYFVVLNRDDCFLLSSGPDRMARTSDDIIRVVTRKP